MPGSMLRCTVASQREHLPHFIPHRCFPPPLSGSLATCSPSTSTTAHTVEPARRTPCKHDLAAVWTHKHGKSASRIDGGSETAAEEVVGTCMMLRLCRSLRPVTLKPRRAAAYDDSSLAPLPPYSQPISFSLPRAVRAVTPSSALRRRQQRAAQSIQCVDMRPCSALIRSHSCTSSVPTDANCDSSGLVEWMCWLCMLMQSSRASTRSALLAPKFPATVMMCWADFDVGCHCTRLREAARARMTETKTSSRSFQNSDY